MFSIYECEDKACFTEWEQGPQSTSRWKVCVSGKQRFVFSFVWLNAGVPWSTAGKGEAPGVHALAFLRDTFACSLL